MPKFIFQAKNKSGQIQKGEIEALNEQMALDLLKKEELELLEIEQKNEKRKIGSFFTIISLKDKVIFFEQLATLLSSGIAIPAALKLILEQTTNKNLQIIIENLLEDINKGLSFSTALAKYPRVFPKTHVSLIKSGEISGKLEFILKEIVKQLEREKLMSSKIKGALIYPTFIFTFLLAVLIFMSVFVLPNLKSAFSQINNLPITTRFLFSFSDFLLNYWWFCILIIIFLILLNHFSSKIKKIRILKDRLKLTLPLLGDFNKKIFLNRFSSNLSTMLSAGLSISEALLLLAEIFNNKMFKDTLINFSNQTAEGKTLSSILKTSKIFPPIVIQMVTTGEEAGQLDKMLKKIADFYEHETESFAKNFANLIEPILLIFIGILVAIFIISIVYPLYQNISSAGL